RSAHLAAQNVSVELTGLFEIAHWKGQVERRHDQTEAPEVDGDHCTARPATIDGGLVFVCRSPGRSAQKPSSPDAPMSDIDPKRLIDQVSELVDAARRAGADAADAVAVRSRSKGVSVRLGKVESTESSESDDVSLR